MVYKPTNTTGGHHQRHGQIFGKRGALADSTIGTVPVDVHWQRDKKAATMWQLPAINQTAECIYIYYNKIIYIYIYIYIYIRHFINSQEFFIKETLLQTKLWRS